MLIQWFPGHMAKARREVTEKLRYVDIVFELVDARLPLSSRNPMMDEIIQQKPRLILLNKSDLADSRQTQKWQHYFETKGFRALAINSQQARGINQILPTSKEILREKIERQRSKGMKDRAIRSMVIGIPNVGKSTLMNRLVKKNIANTGNKPGVTKGQQWLRVGNDLELLDTPGILWPKFEDQEIGRKLALTGAIKDNLLHMDELAMYGLDFLKKYHSENLKARYKLTEEEALFATPELLMRIAQKRGFREDYERASEMIVQEIRNGMISRFTLDRYEDQEGFEDEE